MDIETVRVVADVTDENPLGYVVINKSDLTEDHKIFDESAKKPAKTKAKAADAAVTAESLQDNDEA